VTFVMTYSPLQLADAFIRTGELSDALEALNAHLASSPDDDEARRLRVAVLMRLPGDESARLALADLDQLSTANTDDLVQRSIIQQGLGDWKAANAAMEQAHRLRPDDERISERYVETLAKSGQVARAFTLLASLPRTWRWLQIAGDLARDTDNFHVAAYHYADAIAHLESQMDTTSNDIAANLKAILVMKLESVQG
jgi:tetratricopeptide (TPR) repeat protein